MGSCRAATHSAYAIPTLNETKWGVFSRPFRGNYERQLQMLAATLDAIPGVHRKGRGRSRRRPDRLHADKGYDYRRCRTECQARGIRLRIARRGIESRQRLGRHCWAVERTHAWTTRLRQLAICYERREDIHLAFVILGCALVCFNQIRRFY